MCELRRELSAVMSVWQSSLYQQVWCESYHVPQPRAEREHYVSLIRRACSLQLNESSCRGDKCVVMVVFGWSLYPWWCESTCNFVRQKRCMNLLLNKNNEHMLTTVKKYNIHADNKHRLMSTVVYMHANVIGHFCILFPRPSFDMVWCNIFGHLLEIAV